MGLKYMMILSRFPIENTFLFQVFVDQVNPDVVSVTRHCPKTHKSVVVVAHTAFSDPAPHDVASVQNNAKYSGHIPPLIIPGTMNTTSSYGQQVLRNLEISPRLERLCIKLLLMYS